MEGEQSRSFGEEIARGLGGILGEILKTMEEKSRKDSQEAESRRRRENEEKERELEMRRQVDREAHREGLQVLAERLQVLAERLRVLAERFEALQLAQIKSQESQRTSIEVPIPKFNGGKPSEFDEWKDAVRNCIKCNGWTDEKRIIEMLPVSLSGQAYRAYSLLTLAQKGSLEAIFAALKSQLDPKSKSYNRKLVLEVKSSPNEALHSFVSCGTQCRVRSDECAVVDEGTWANKVLPRKIYTNLNITDTKIKRSSAGEVEYTQILCGKADELLNLSEELVSSATCQGDGSRPERACQNEPPKNRSYNGQWSNEYGRDFRPGNNVHAPVFRPRRNKNYTQMVRPGGSRGYPRTFRPGGNDGYTLTFRPGGGMREKI